MKIKTDIILVVPIGPGCKPEYAIDTIASFVYYCRSNYQIVVADDSQQNTGQLIRNAYPEANIVTTPESMGKFCGLYITLSLAYRYAWEKYAFDVLLRLDTDALIIGEAPDLEILQFFREHPQIGIAGQYPNDYSGMPWDKSWPAAQIKKYTSTYKFFKKPTAHFQLLKRLCQASWNGYETGESVFGGAYAFSAECLRRLQKAGLLPDYRLRDILLEEDHLFTILITAVGLHPGDFSSGNAPFGCAWVGLPASPAALQSSGKKIIHSVRNFKSQTESEIRAYFKSFRSSEPVSARIAN